MATVNPAVAIALLYFHPDFRDLPVNMLRGATAFPGIPTMRTFELGLNRTDDLQAIRESYETIDPGLCLERRGVGSCGSVSARRHASTGRLSRGIHKPQMTRPTDRWLAPWPKRCDGTRQKSIRTRCRSIFILN